MKKTTPVKNINIKLLIKHLNEALGSIVSGEDEVGIEIIEGIIKELGLIKCKKNN
jgi:hypothetical protein